MKSLSSVELLLLIMIHETPEISGYKINRKIKARNLREWTDIGLTSIYNGLNKLEKKGAVVFYIKKDKQGKGPLPKLYTLTEKGKDLLKKEINRMFSEPDFSTNRFSVALIGIVVLSKDEAITALNNRKNVLRNMYDSIQAKMKAQNQDLNYQNKMLYKYSYVHLIEEIRFVDFLIKDYKNETSGSSEKEVAFESL